MTTCAASHSPGYGSVSRRVKPGLPPLNPQAPPRAARPDGTPPGALAGASVTVRVVEHTKGPKIRIHKFKNKTGYHKRMGHRQQLTHLRITAVDNGK